jgi:hypothetical protein
LIDNRDYKTPTQECMDLHLEGLELTNKAGVGKTAFIVTQLVVKFTGGRVLRESGMEETTRQFNDPEEAEDWLDGENV